MLLNAWHISAHSREAQANTSSMLCQVEVQLVSKHLLRHRFVRMR